eukprot:SAG22_NODE_7519_length_732_cov_0.593997_1_plen_205_part_01
MAATVQQLGTPGGGWDRAQVAETYFANGYVRLPGLLPAAVLAPIIGKLDRSVDGIAKSLGSPADAHAGLPLETRLTAILGGQSTELVAGLPSPFVPQENEADERGIFELATFRPLLDILAALLGPQIAYDNSGLCRCILPATSRPRDRTTQGFPQHADSQYFDTTLLPKSDDGAVRPGHPLSSAALHIVTAWAPLVDCDEENSCL